MSDNPLSGKVGIDTSDFKTGIAEMNRGIRLLEAQFKAAAAGLQDWASDASGLEARVKALNGQIDLQKAKIAALTGEYNKVVAEQGAGSKAAQDLTIKILKQQEALGKMEKELGTTETSLDQMGQEAQGTGKDVGQLKKSEDGAATSTKTLGQRLGELKGKLKDAGAGIRGFVSDVARVAAGIAVGLAGAVAAVGTGLGAMILKTAQTADGLVELSDKTGIGVERLQELAYVGEQTGTDLETMTGSLSKLVKSMDAATQRGTPAAEAFKKLGVNVKDSNGNLRDSEDVFMDVINALGTIPNEAERDALAMEIFGKSAAELNPLIKAGGEEIANLTDEAHQMGAVMGEDAVEGAASFNDTLAKLKAMVGGVAGRVATTFIPLVQKAADAIITWFSSPAVQKGIDSLVEGLSGIADTVGKVLDELFAGDFQGALAEVFGADAAGDIISTVKQIAGYVTTLADTVGKFISEQIIPFVQQHGPEIKGALAAIGIALGVVAVIIPAVSAIIGALSSPILAIVAAAGLLGAAWAGNWGGIRDTLTDIWNNTLKPALTELWTWLQTNIPLAIQALTNFWNTKLLPALQAVGTFITTKIVPVFQDIYNWLAVNVPAAIQAVSDFWNNTLIPALQAAYDFFNDYIMPILQAVADVMDAALTLAITALAGLWENVLQPAIEKVYNFFVDNVLPILQDVAEVVGETLGPKVEVLGGIFKDLGDTLSKGVRKALEWVYNTLKDLAEFLKGFDLPDWLKPGSPTPFEMGLRGIAKAAQQLQGPMEQLSKGFDSFGRTPNLSGGGAGAGGSQAAQAAGPTEVTIVLQGQMTPLNMRRLASQVAEEIQRRR